MNAICRILLFLLAFCVSALFAGVAVMAGVLGVFVWFTGRQVPLSHRTVPVWPSFFPSLEIPEWAGPWYVAGGALVLLIGLPLAIAFLEQVYVLLREQGNSTPPEETLT